jgi:hypothetical protein
MKTIKKAQLGGLIKKGVKAVAEGASTKPISLAKKVKEAKFQKNKGKFGMTEDITLKEFKKMGKDATKGSTPSYNVTSKPVVLTAEQKANNARILKEIREGKRKNGGTTMKKAKSGTSLGMKSVKAGFDKNPGITRADVITAAKGKAKSGAKMTKCKYGCK